MTSNVPKSANELSAERTDLSVRRTDLSVERTVMGAGRTLMAWIRTALSMISFGFTIYKFMQAAVQGSANGMMQVMGPRRLGLFLIALGVTSVILGTLEYFHAIKRLNRMSAATYKPVNFAFVVGILIGLLGLFLFVTILTHTEVF